MGEQHDDAYERLFLRIVSHLHHEQTALTERSNGFLTVSSILVGGIGLLASQIPTTERELQILTMCLLAVCGMGLSLVGLGMGRSATRRIRFWRAYARLLGFRDATLAEEHLLDLASRTGQVDTPLGRIAFSRPLRFPTDERMLGQILPLCAFELWSLILAWNIALSEHALAGAFAISVAVVLAGCQLLAGGVIFATPCALRPLEGASEE